MLNNLLTCTCCLLAIHSFGQTDTVPSVASSSSFTTVTGFKCSTKDNSRVVLSWHLLSMTPADYFSIQRSCNGKDFETIAVIKEAIPDADFEWTDEAPAKGRNLYRVRYTMKDGYSFETNSLATQVAGDISFRFYPNPVDNILIVRTEAPTDIQILDETGKVRIQVVQVTGLKLINVSGIEKGVYLLRAQNKQSNLTKQEQLIKN